MNGKGIIILSILISLFITNAKTIAQEADTKPKYGLTASFQDSQFDIIVPVWISNSIKIAPAVSYISVSDVGSDFSIGVILNSYFRRAKVSPYIGFRAGTLILSPENGDSVGDTILGASFGGEYFIDDYFSFGIEAQVNVSMSDEKSNRFGNPDGTNINTGMAVFGSIYF